MLKGHSAEPRGLSCVHSLWWKLVGSYIRGKSGTWEGSQPWIDRWAYRVLIEDTWSSMRMLLWICVCVASPGCRMQDVCVCVHNVYLFGYGCRTRSHHMHHVHCLGFRIYGSRSAKLEICQLPALMTAGLVILP